jgi:hypothetical protein
MPGDINNNLTDAQRKEAAEAAAALAAPSDDKNSKRNKTLDDRNFNHMNEYSEIKSYGGFTTNSKLGNTIISDFGLGVRAEGFNTEFGVKANFSLSPKTLTTQNEIGPEAPEFSSSFYGAGASMNFLNNNLALQSYAGFGKTQNAVFLDNGSVYSAEKTSPAIQFGASTGPNLKNFNLGFSYTTYLSGAEKVQPATQEIGVYNQPNYLEFSASVGFNNIDISHRKSDEDKIGVNAFAKLGTYLGGDLNVSDQHFGFDTKPILSLGLKFTTNSLSKGK